MNYGRGHIICFFGTTGGAGRTFLAVNLAAALARLGKRAVIVDFDMHGGGVGECLGLKPAKTLGDYLREQEDVSVSDYLTDYRDNLAFLASPERPEPTLVFRSEKAVDLLSELRADYEFVVVDLPACLENHVAATLEEADMIGLVARNENLSVRRAVFSLQSLALLGYDLQAVRLIVNGFRARGLSTTVIEQAVGLPVYWRIDYDKHAMQSGIKGSPLVKYKRRGSTAASVTRLAKAFISESAKRESRE